MKNAEDISDLDQNRLPLFTDAGGLPLPILG